MLLVVWTGAWHHPLSRLVVIAQLQKARSYSVERDVGKATFFFPLSFYNKLSSNALRIWNESSHLQNAQHFLRGSQVVGHEMPAFSRKVAGNGSRETEMHRLITENENLSGGGYRGSYFIKGLSFRDKNKIRNPHHCREGEKSWHGKQVRGRWPLGAKAAAWLHLGVGGAPALAFGGFLLLGPGGRARPETCPAPPSHPVGRPLGILLTVLLATESSAPCLTSLHT